MTRFWTMVEAAGIDWRTEMQEHLELSQFHTWNTFSVSVLSTYF